MASGDDKPRDNDTLTWIIRKKSVEPVKIKCGKGYERKDDVIPVHPKHPFLPSSKRRTAREGGL
ncbi:hypothetical protein IMY05_018G0077200 [Salix suchowensis]|nr:hypothetical protein IMY05_018G0077200 [Salix suchowensis]